MNAEQVIFVLKCVYFSIILSIRSVIFFPRQIPHLEIPTLYDLPAFLYLLFVFCLGVLSSVIFIT